MVRRILPLFLAMPMALTAQSDTARLSAVVVTADRAPSAINSSTSAVTRVSGAELARLPHVTLADVLRLAPGFNVVNFDGLGYDPQLMVRGFYGGGEAEYVVVLVDGRPVNQLHTGVVAWDALPPVASIEAVEIVRGGNSSLYGDAALAGVINVVTRNAHAVKNADVRFDAAGGSSGSFRAAADATSGSLWNGASLSAAIDGTEGYRDHSRRTTGRVRGTVGLLEGVDSRLGVTASSHWRSFNEPGPLIASLFATNKRASDPLFRFDHTDDQTHAVNVDGSYRTGRTRLTGMASGEYRKFDAIRTLALAPGFGDTKNRDANTTRGALAAQAEIDDSPLPGRDRLILGAEGSHGELESKYYKVLTAPRAAYAGAPGTRGAIDTDGSSRRNAGAVYGDYSLHPTPALRVSLGGRYDKLDDAFDRSVPVGGTRQTTSHSAFSPKGGLNFQYLNENGHTGNVYVAASRSFKAPTLDQLYDQRRFPVQFPPFQITTSNPALQPQYGTSYEGGVYQGVDLSSGVHLTGSLSGYQMDMVDELDFDVQALRYVNLGRSRHRGIEASANAEGARSSAFATYTLQAATLRSGDAEGNRIKAIPQHTLNGGFTVAPVQHLDASLIATHVRGVYLDDANTVTLPNYTRVDFRVGVRAAGRSLFAEVRNVFDERYSSSGYLDPAGTGEAYFYPAAGRILEIGLRSGF